MSYPRLGVLEETSGDFQLNFNWEYIIIDDINYIRIEPLEESFEIKNEYFKELFEKKHIQLSWQINSHKTFFHQSILGFKFIDINCSKISGNISVGYSMIAINDFTLKPTALEFNQFFVNSEFNIKKGTILSDDGREFIIKPKLLEHSGSSSIVRFKLQENLPEEFSIDFTTDKYITYSIKNKDFVDSLKTLLRRKKKIKHLIINNFFSAIYIEAIQRLSDDQEELSWKDDLKEIVKFNEANKDLYSDFEGAYKIYNSFLANNNSIIEETLKELNNIVSHD